MMFEKKFFEFKIFFNFAYLIDLTILFSFCDTSVTLSFPIYLLEREYIVSWT